MKRLFFYPDESRVINCTGSFLIKCRPAARGFSLEFISIEVLKKVHS